MWVVVVVVVIVVVVVLLPSGYGLTTPIPPQKITQETEAKHRERSMEPTGEMREKVFDLTAKCCEPLPTLPPQGWGRTFIRHVLKGPN